MSDIRKIPTGKHSDADQDRAIRLMAALADLQSEGQYVFSVRDLARRAQVAPAFARLAAQDWTDRGWVQLHRASRHGPLDDAMLHLITAKAPGAPSEAALSTICLLQLMGNVRRLAYGYGSALQLHGLTELVISDIYVCEQDQTVKPPKYAPGSQPATFKRSTKTPSVWGQWQGRRVYKVLRSPAMLRPHHRTIVPFQGVQVPCTTVMRTLVDCWLRPDLCGGEDRMSDAWTSHLDANEGDHGIIAAELASILQDANWSEMTTAFVPWLETLYRPLARLVAARVAP